MCLKGEHFSKYLKIPLCLSLNQFGSFLAITLITTSMLNKDSPAKRETELISVLDQTIISTNRTDEHSQMRRIIEKAKIATREHQFWRRTQKVVWESLHCVLVEHKPKSVKKIKIIDKFRKTRVKAAEVWNWQHHAKLHATRTWAVASLLRLIRWLLCPDFATMRNHVFVRNFWHLAFQVSSSPVTAPALFALSAIINGGQK